MRSIVKKLSAQPFGSNTDTKQSYRVIGTTDIDGHGTKHGIADVDPFIFLDETCMRGDESWPFAKHPHMGLVAMTYMLSGEVKPWDNHTGVSAVNNSAGGLYYINSGRGILHEEEPIVSGGPLRWLQLWLNPGVYGELPKASKQLAHASTIPQYTDDSMTVRVVVGQYHDVNSPVHADWPIQYLHVFLKPSKKCVLDLGGSEWAAFIYVLEGNGQFGKNVEQAGRRDCLVLDNDSTDQIEVSNSNDNNNLEFVLVSGMPHRKPCYKLLGGGGALIHGDKKSVRVGMARYEDEQDRFGMME